MNKIWDETMSQFELPAPPDGGAQAAREVRGEPAAGELHFRELLNLLRRRSRSILAITLCGAMLVFAIGLLIPPKFTAKAEIAIYMPATGGQGAAPSRDESVIETHIATLLSRDQLTRVANDLMNIIPAFHTEAPVVQHTEPEQVADQAPPPAPVAAHWLPGPSELAHRLRVWIGHPRIGGDATTLSVDELERHLGITQVGRSRVIAVRYTSTDPDRAEIIANRIANCMSRIRRSNCARLPHRTGAARASHCGIEGRGCTVRHRRTGLPATAGRRRKTARRRPRSRSKPAGTRT